MQCESLHFHLPCARRAHPHLQRAGASHGTLATSQSRAAHPNTNTADKPYPAPAPSLPSQHPGSRLHRHIGHTVRMSTYFTLVATSCPISSTIGRACKAIVTSKLFCFLFPFFPLLLYTGEERQPIDSQIQTSRLVPTSSLRPSTLQHVQGVVPSRMSAASQQATISDRSTL